MTRVLVFGSINMDLVVETSTFPRLGETLPGASFATHAGGKGANQAVAAARLGAHVTMLGRVGSDAFGAELKARLAAEGVATGWRPRNVRRVDRDRSDHRVQRRQRHRRGARRQRAPERGRSRRGGVGVRAS